MKIPLHLNQDDYSKEACAKRVEHNVEMCALNPSGFRNQPKNKKTIMRNEKLAIKAGLYQA